MNIDLDKLDNLPLRESRKQYMVRKHGNLRNLNKWSYNCKLSSKSVDPWFITNNIVKKFIGNDFDKAYSYLCTKLPYYKRHWFTGNIGNGKYDKWLIDDNNCIQYNPNYYYIKTKPTKKIYFISIDYTEGWYIKKSRLYMTDYEFKSIYWSLNYKDPKLFEHVAIKVVLNGLCKEFDSKKDKEYIRLSKEKQKQIKYYKKLNKKLNKQKIYSFLTKEEEQLKQEKELDIIKRDSHGFDENSFKYDPYHSNKQKLKL